MSTKSRTRGSKDSKGGGASSLGVPAPHRPKASSSATTSSLSPPVSKPRSVSAGLISPKPDPPPAAPAAIDPLTLSVDPPSVPLISSLFSVDTTRTTPQPLSVDLIRRSNFPPHHPIHKKMKEEGKTAEQINAYLFSLPKLYLDGWSLTSISDVELFTHLEFLYLQRNQIVKMEKLSFNTKLKFLVLANNKIKKVEGLKGLTQLRYLDLRSNEIEVVDWEELPLELEGIDMRGNPIRTKWEKKDPSMEETEEEKKKREDGMVEYQRQCVSMLPYLRHFDGDKIGNKERKEWGIETFSEDEEEEEEDIGEELKEKVDNADSKSSSLIDLSASIPSAASAITISLNTTHSDMVDRSQHRQAATATAETQHAESIQKEMETRNKEVVEGRNPGEFTSNAQ